MPECRFSLTRIFPYKGRLVDSVLIRESTGQKKHVFQRILCSVILRRFMVPDVS